MWKDTLTAIATLAILSTGAHARPSENNEVAAAIGGLITGVILSEIVDDANISVEFASYRGCRDNWDRYDSNYRDYDSRYRPDSHYRPDSRYHGKSGHYEWEKRRVWVDGYWDYTRDRCGRSVKIWIKGHYEIRNVKIWVEDRHPDYRRGESRCRS